MFIVKRRVMQLLLCFGVLLTLAAGTLWVWGFWYEYSLRIHRASMSDTTAFSRRLDAGFNRRRVWWEYTRNEADFDTRIRKPAVPYRPRYRFELHRFARSVSGDGAAPNADAPLWERLGFQFGIWKDPNPPGMARRMAMHHAGIPMWFATLAPAALTLLAFRSLRRSGRAAREALRRQRAGGGLCLACGYDLSGADHERCPECGQLVPSASHGEPSALSKMK